MIIAGSLIISIAIYSLSKSENIKSIWIELEQSSSEKERTLSAMRSQLGYGGMIHNFKNLVLRDNLDKASTVASDIGGVKAVITRYRTFELNNDERIALDKIAAVINKYNNSLLTILKLKSLGVSPEQIDLQVQVNDQPAIEGLQHLDTDVHHKSGYKKHYNNVQSKAHLISRLRKALGYNGMIHHYKNYILRGHEKYFASANISLQEALKIIVIYKHGIISKKESNAIGKIKIILSQYELHLSQIKMAIEKNLTPKEIDLHASINDVPAFEAMNALDQEIIKYNYHQKAILFDALTSVISSEKNVVYITSVIVALILILSIWFFHLQLIAPIQNLTKLMQRLSHDDTAIKIPENISTNEINDMADSVKVFRTNVIRRDKAEKELLDVNEELEKRVIERTQEVKLNEQRLSSLVETAADSIITIDEKGIIQSFNTTAIKMFGYHREEIIGQNVTRLMPKPYQTEHHQYLTSYKKTGKAKIIGIGRETLGLHKNGETFPIDLAISEINHAGKIIYTGIIRDMSERNRKEEQLRHSQKMNALGKLTGGIAHDYNNMLNVILGYSELLQDEEISRETTIKYINEIKHAGERGAQLTSKLLSFSRKKASSTELCNINSILIDNYDMLEKTLTSRINLIFNLCEEPRDVTLDSGELENAILNLSINAMHSMPYGGKLSITTKMIDVDTMQAKNLDIQQGQYLRLSIKDTGSGIDKAIQESIFDPFFSTKGELGNGLGLSQVYGFIKRVGGAIEVYSELGHGSNFILYFPILSESNHQTDSHNDPLINYSGHETILVVDDEPAIKNMTSDMLEMSGYKVLRADSGEQALEILQTETAHLMISDILMPDMDGYLLTAQVQLLYPSIKIQLVSGYSESVFSDQIDKTITEGILQKPFERITLLAKVRDLLDS